MKKISVLISAYNDHPVTVAHVMEAMNSTRVPDEIIVVNDHGDPGLKEMLEVLPRKCRLIYAYITQEIPWNYTGARNLAFWISRGDYVVVEDNDQIPNRTFYEEAEKMLDSRPELGRVLGSDRYKVSRDDISKPLEEWVRLGKRPNHDDTAMVRREDFIQVKGYDERFAGAYAWACTDWRRRHERGGLKQDYCLGNFWCVIDCDKDGGVKKLIRRRSYRNYQYARESDGHVQSPIGVLNFTYETTFYEPTN